MPTRSAAVIVALVPAWRPRATIKLRRGEVHVAAAAEEVFERLRSRTLAGGDLVAGEVIGLLTLAVHAEVPVEHLRRVIYTYPTFHRGVEDASSSAWSRPSVRAWRC